MSEDISTQMIIVTVTAILSFITGWGVSILNDKKNRNHTVFAAIQSMMAELKAMKKAIDDKSIEPAIKTSEPDSNGRFSIEVKYHSFHTATYDSMLYSGVFRELEPEIQRKIADTYESIKVYNSSRVQAQNIGISLSALSTTNLRTNVSSYGDMIDVLLNFVIKNVEELILLLEKKYPKINDSQM